MKSRYAHSVADLCDVQVNFRMQMHYATLQTRVRVHVFNIKQKGKDFVAAANTNRSDGIFKRKKIRQLYTMNCSSLSSIEHFYKINHS